MHLKIACFVSKKYNLYYTVLHYSNFFTEVMNLQFNNTLQSSIFNPTLRKWQCIGTEVTPNNLMYPIFIIEDDNAIQSIENMPGVSRFGINSLKEHLDHLVLKGLQSVMLFAVIDSLPRDENGTHADSNENPVIKALPLLRKWFPDLTIACNICLCSFTSNGQCAILHEDGHINSKASVKRMTEIALAHAKAGAHIIAPSDMIDGRIQSIKEAFNQNNLLNKVAVLSYTAKFASCFYGPFTTAINSDDVGTESDKECHQLPLASKGMALRGAKRDVSEGADMLMVKPGMMNSDIIKTIKNEYPDYPLFVYQVSGEYAMLYYASQKNVFKMKEVLKEVFSSFRRAGADVIITYYTPMILEWMDLKNLL